MAEISLDGFQVVHWMNAGKLTPAYVASENNRDESLLEGLFTRSCSDIPFEDAQRLSAELDVPLSDLAREVDLPESGVLFQSAGGSSTIESGLTALLDTNCLHLK